MGSELSGFPDSTDAEEFAGGYPGLYWGTVTNNKDPRKLGRVKVHVPGVTTKETDWAYPIGMPGAGYPSSTGGKGGFYVPRELATVLVAFVYGKLEEPVYLCGHFPMKDGVEGVPRIVAQQTAEQAPNVRVIAETESFEIYITDTDTEKKIVIQTLVGTSMIEMDANDGSIKLKAAKSLIFDAPAVQIDGLTVTIKNRPVSPLGLAI